MTDNKQRDNISSYYDPVTMPGGWRFKHAETLKIINLYYQSQYQTGNTDEQGMRKFFFKIVRPACDIASKFIDLRRIRSLVKRSRRMDILLQRSPRGRCFESLLRISEQILQRSGCMSRRLCTSRI